MSRLTEAYVYESPNQPERNRLAGLSHYRWNRYPALRTVMR
jgi:hypothetical protein